MIQTNDTQLAEDTSTTVVDFETAAARITTDRITAVLLHIAASENVRVIEALAAAIVNALQSGKEAQHPFIFSRARLLRYPSLIATDETAKTAAFRRIARRALSQTLNDPTLGATVFHHIEASPTWSRNSLPIAVFGSFLFYRV